MVSEESTPHSSNAHLSEINPEFATLVPAVNDAFASIWQGVVPPPAEPKMATSMTDFRAAWRKSPPTYPAYVPESGFDTTHQVVPVRDGAEVEIRVYKPHDAPHRDLPLLFVLHGGGWVVGTHDSENSVCRSVCVKNRMMVISVDYRRAPEYKFPFALNDSYDVFEWAMKHDSELGFDRQKVVLFGTSAGANLAAALCLQLRDAQDTVMPKGQILNVPATCHPKHFPKHKYELNSYEQNALAPTTNAAHMLWFWEQYHPNASDDEYASPLLAKSHAGLPPTLIQVGGLDPLRDEGIAYAKALQDAGVKTSLEVYPGLPHGFMLAVKMDFTTLYYKTVVEWLEKLSL